MFLLEGDDRQDDQHMQGFAASQHCLPKTVKGRNSNNLLLVAAEDTCNVCFFLFSSACFRDEYRENSLHSESVSLVTPSYKARVSP